MEKKFQYAKLGAGITILAIAGIFVLLISNARANRLPVTTSETQTAHEVSTVAPNVQVIEDAPISNVLNHSAKQNLLNAEESAQLPPASSTDAEAAPIKDVGTAVLTRVAELNTQRMKVLLANNGGWLYVQAERYAPNSSNAPLPNGSNLPTLQLSENWYYVDADGLAHQSYDRMLDENGITIQEGYFQEGTFYNEMGEPTDELGMPAFSVLPDQDAYGFLRRDFESGAELVGWLEQRDDRTVYMATSTTYFDKPVEFGVSTDKVISTQYHFTYDVADGAFLYGETVFVLENGEQLVWESITQTALKIVPETDLPEQLTRFLAEN